MKIAFVEPHLKMYGGIRRIVELANRLHARGHEVVIYHSDGAPCTWLPCQVRVRRRQELTNEQHDVVIYNHPNPFDYHLVKKATARLKVFYVLELYRRNALKWPLVKTFLLLNPRMIMRMFYLKKSLTSPYLIVSNATWMQQWLTKELHLDAHLLIGGINAELFHPVPVQRDRSTVQILCSGDPRPRKGTQTVIAAFEIVKRHTGNVVLTTYHGKGISQDKMAHTYCSADIFVDAQWYAGWNNPVAEAMACGVPVVCTDIGGVKDFAFHEETALLVPVENAQALAQAILRLIRNDPLRERLRENALRKIKQFDWDTSIATFEAMLKTALSQKGAA